jgi:hypothetical protein
VELSYLEIYKEEIRDLLSTTSTTHQEMKIREKLEGDVYVSGLTEQEVRCTKTCRTVHGESLPATSGGLHDHECRIQSIPCHLHSPNIGCYGRYKVVRRNDGQLHGQAHIGGSRRK